MTLYAQISAAEQAGEPVALCTVIAARGSTPRRAGSKMLVRADGTLTGTVGGGEVEARVRAEALAALQDGLPRRLSYDMVDPAQGDPGTCGGSLEVYVEPILPPPLLLVVGGGHVGRAVAHLGRWLGFRVAVSDDRAEFCTPQANPDAHDFYPVPMADLPAVCRITPHTAVVLTTRGSAVDAAGLPALLATPAAYIGVIGSRRRWLTTRKALLQAGTAAADLDRVVSPVGLELNAETPEEIAVSILAQIIAQRGGGDGKPMNRE